MSLFPEFIQPVLEAPWAWLLLLIVFIFYLNYKSLTAYKDQPESSQQAIALLREDKFGHFYHTLLGKTLDKVSAWLGDKERFNKQIAHHHFFSTNSFSPQSYEFVLRLAFLYPILFFLLAWVWSGETAPFTSPFSNVLSEQRGLLLALAFLVPFVFLLLTLKLCLTSRWFLLLVLWGLFGAFGFAGEFSVFFVICILLFIPCYIVGMMTNWLINHKQTTCYQEVERFAFTFAFTFASVFVFTGFQPIIAIAVIVAVAIIRPIAISNAAIGSIIGAIAIAVAMTGLDSLVASESLAIVEAPVAVVGAAGAMILMDAIAMIGASACAGLLFIVLTKARVYSEKKQINTLFLIAYSFVFLLFAFLVIADDNRKEDTTPLLLFCLLLPFINAFLDWLSLGITRGLLHRIHHQYQGGWQVFAWLLFDMVLAICLLGMISVLLIIPVGIVDRMSGQTVLQDALEALSDPDMAQAYYWVYAMLLTTLVPTLVHFAVAGASLTLWLPQQWRHNIANHLEKNHGKPWAASFYLTFTPIIGLFAPFALLYGLYLLVTAHGGWLGGVLLDWANLLAGVIV